MLRPMIPLLRSSVFDLLSPILADEGIELVDVEYQEGSDIRSLRLLIYKPSGVNVEDCQHVSQIVIPILEVYEVVEGKYNLEVASLGLDRPLVTATDFRRNLGQKIHIEMFSSTEGFLHVNGVLKDVSEDQVFLNQACGKTTRVLISEIANAQIQLMW